jgi:hypothetical protein
VSDDLAERRSRDLHALRALLMSDRLREDEAESFDDMLTRLERGRFPLTEKQRAWVLSRCEELGVDPDPRSHEERNRDVPRGREVATPPVLTNLPKAPPRRKLS